MTELSVLYIHLLSYLTNLNDVQNRYLRSKWLRALTASHSGTGEFQNYICIDFYTQQL